MCMCVRQRMVGSIRPSIQCTIKHCVQTIPVSVKEHSSKEEYPWGIQFEKHQIRGWRALSAAVLQGRGTSKRNDLFTDTGMSHDVSSALARSWRMQCRGATCSTGSCPLRGPGHSSHITSYAIDIRELHEPGFDICLQLLRGSLVSAYLCNTCWSFYSGKYQSPQISAILRKTSTTIAQTTVKSRLTKLPNRYHNFPRTTTTGPTFLCYTMLPFSNSICVVPTCICGVESLFII